MMRGIIFFLSAVCLLLSYKLVPYWSFLLEGSVMSETQQAISLHVFGEPKYGTGVSSMIFLLSDWVFFLDIFLLGGTIFLCKKTWIAKQLFVSYLALGCSLLLIFLTLMSVFSVQERLGSGEVLSYPSWGFYFVLVSFLLMLIGIVRIRYEAERLLL